MPITNGSYDVNYSCKICIIITEEREKKRLLLILQGVQEEEGSERKGKGFTPDITTKMFSFLFFGFHRIRICINI